MPISLTIDKTTTGQFRARLADREFEASSIEDLVHQLGTELSRAFGEEAHAEPGAADNEAEFEADLDYALNKNAELYRRLAR
jgi:hypothetical protein